MFACSYVVVLLELPIFAATLGTAFLILSEGATGFPFSFFSLASVLMFDL